MWWLWIMSWTGLGLRGKSSVMEEKETSLAEFMMRSLDSLRQWADACVRQWSNWWVGCQVEIHMGIDLFAFPSLFFSPCNVSTLEEFPRPSFNYLSAVFVFSDTCGSYKSMGSSSHSGRVIQWGPFKASISRAQIDFFLRLFLPHSGFLGFPCRCRIMTFDTNRYKAK